MITSNDSAIDICLDSINLYTKHCFDEGLISYIEYRDIRLLLAKVYLKKMHYLVNEVEHLKLFLINLYNTIRAVLQL